MSQPYDKADGSRLSVQFQTIDGDPLDPSVITFTMKKPGSQPVSYTYGGSPPLIMRTGIGAYYIDVNLDVSGIWRYKWTGAGALVAAEEGSIFVRASNV